MLLLIHAEKLSYSMLAKGTPKVLWYNGAQWDALNNLLVACFRQADIDFVDMWNKNAHVMFEMINSGMSKESPAWCDQQSIITACVVDI